ncbi:hypothetical protein VNO78_23685 [Psophocarpus tetragonolobus]|uniref:Uncharacterized protein n=1 Tax=Psophocarpus tetragonolobus TaxID=3891 RepID=A0AAN9XDT8_PSOTE
MRDPRRGGMEEKAQDGFRSLYKPRTADSKTFSHFFTVLGRCLYQFHALHQYAVKEGRNYDEELQERVLPLSWLRSVLSESSSLELNDVGRRLRDELVE